MQYSIEGPSAVTQYGFQYLENSNGAHVHMLNDVPVKIELGAVDNINAELIDSQIDKVFKSVLQNELISSGVKKIHKIEWDRIFIFNGFLHGEKDLNSFTARLWIRITGEKTPNTLNYIGGR